MNPLRGGRGEAGGEQEKEKEKEKEELSNLCARYALLLVEEWDVGERVSNIISKVYKVSFLDLRLGFHSVEVFYYINYLFYLIYYRIDEIAFEKIIREEDWEE